MKPPGPRISLWFLCYSIFSLKFIQNFNCFSNFSNLVLNFFCKISRDGLLLLLFIIESHFLSLATGLSILLTFSKNQLSVPLISSFLSLTLLDFNSNLISFLCSMGLVCSFLVSEGYWFGNCLLYYEHSEV